MYVHACFGVWKFNGTVYNNVRLCSRDQNPKWPPFSPTIAEIKHDLIDFCYINMILFCPFLCFTIPGLKRNYFNWCPPTKENRLIFKMAVILTEELKVTFNMQKPRCCAYSYILVYGQEHSSGIYLYCLNYTRNTYMYCFNITRN